eukprot:TRINITY_DN1207_c0_g1_i1.p1 TRINITY_DN1207_c0_g1~~TRINITY_DN1207_c0_g1_i1.p1  ORF type:complete len:172 (-),score=31.81 TRINITY_DN1207_c0_g1_i1:174-689(-)
MSAAIKRISALVGVAEEKEYETLSNPQTGFMLEEIVGDLFSCDRDTALAHCVSRDLAMGKGIAVQFKNRFGGLDCLRRQNQRVGGCAWLESNGRFVFYLVTKERYFNKPTYADLKNSLESVKELCQSHDVKSLAMPRIGCGLDGLIWGQVKRLIKEVFDSTCIGIHVYRLE